MHAELLERVAGEPDSGERRDADMLDEAFDYGYKAGLKAGLLAGRTEVLSPAKQINGCDYLRSLYGKQV